MLNLIAAFFICSGIGIAVWIIYDLSRHKQSMKIMNAVWVLSALWGGYFVLWAYNKFGREQIQMKMDDRSMMMESPRSFWQSVSLSAFHCGAGCTLADILGEWITYCIPVHINGNLLLGSWVLDFILALIIGVYFQFYAIREMEKISVSQGLFRAFKADFFSLTSWQVGMYGWMAVVYFIFFKGISVEKDTWLFWFMMQIAMFFGFICAYPMNVLLIKSGVKKGM